MNHVSVSPTDGNGPTQGQRKAPTRVGIVAQSVERRRSNPKVVGSIPTLVGVFLSLCGPISISRANAHMVHMGLGSSTSHYTLFS